ncbi:MAG TPA: high-potential iron-sulfur protein [Polyangiales bacterium]|nr:high-potential iron-sulfur protein [Polyangiales bacterium]
MTKRSLSRREMLRSTANLLVIGSASMMLHGCKKAEFRCDDVSGLSNEDAKLREALEYQDRSPHGEKKNCSNCAFFRPAEADECGACTLIRGPIHPLGYCNSWAAKG